jgi:hypothetical protein
MVGFIVNSDPLKTKNQREAIKKWLFSLHLGHIIGLFYEDILILSGLFFIVMATFMLSKVAGFYCLGGCLFGLGVYFTLFPIKKG